MSGEYHPLKDGMPTPLPNPNHPAGVQVDADAFVALAMRAISRFWRGPDRDPGLSRMRYADYLRTAHWRDVRAMAMLRAGRQCKRCESTDRRLDVHHLSYDRLGREAESDLTVLCAVCHAIAHGRGPQP